MYKMRWLKFIAFCLVLGYCLPKIDFGGQPHGLCPFCDEKNLSKEMVYKGQVASVIKTYKPAVPGHLLIIPNRHVEKYDELTAEEIDEMGMLIKKIHTPQYIILQKNGPLSGQSVPHVHIHFLPRTEDVSLPLFILKFLIAPFLKPDS